MTPFSKLVGYLVKEKVLTEEQIARVLGPTFTVADVRQIHSPFDQVDQVQDSGNLVNEGQVVS